MNVPDPLPVIEGLPTATARVHDLTLVTMNTRHVARTGSAISIRFWQGSPAVSLLPRNASAMPEAQSP